MYIRILLFLGLLTGALAAGGRDRARDKGWFQDGRQLRTGDKGSIGDQEGSQDKKRIRDRGQTVYTDVLVIGGGASGVTTGIQAARMKVRVLIVEETEWLGGMLTAAGVSAIDGDHQLPAGLWGEFRQRLYDHYGGAAAVQTGWVSNTLFEPSVGDRILKNMVAAEPLLEVWYRCRWKGLFHEDRRWRVTVERDGRIDTVVAAILVDATELGDVLARAGARYRIGMDSRDSTGEKQAPERANGIIQDLTYVATLKDYGAGSDKTIPRPAGYDSSEFSCCCQFADPASDKKPVHDCAQMIEYGRLPNKKFMINWPFCGNDLYMDLIEKTGQQRDSLLREARLHTLRFVYYIQTALGFKRLGLADDEYPTPDRLPMIAYYREARRCEGVVRLSLPYIKDPFSQPLALYRTGIAVGDYPIDHHHGKNPAAPKIGFVKIKVPSYNIPMGCLVPAGVKDLLVAEKSISVTNLVNGATRLQPVVLQLGQAAGAMAALCVRQHREPSALDVRSVQGVLLKAGGYLMPYLDVKADDPQFIAIQRIGATGILKGVGVAHNWANETWFYPEKPAAWAELMEGLASYYPGLKEAGLKDMMVGDAMEHESVTPDLLRRIFLAAGRPVSKGDMQMSLSRIKGYSPDTVLSRRAVAVLIDHYLKPFERSIDIDGALRQSTGR
ncbi:MAG: FAD-dependent oxidoreductase [Puia sp.]|nr:FAD-dependent oxidoreductase [Puia sp.]